MPPEPGSRLGPYEIVASIGAGGMGEVYRARDTKLGRDVAVKVLSESTATPALLERFEREARAVAALSHPNILAIYDFAREDPISYAVTELLEGETLRERLRQGPMPPSKAIDATIQICRGLAAAHGKGIVHRDLKPDNLFVTRDGLVKILDFGLAKVEIQWPRDEAIEANDEDESAPTQARGTSAGTVLGTVGYMSPEQVRGQDADPRSDIFSLGTILYEMLTGERAFAGHSAADTMSAILKEDPPEARIAPALKRVVQRCLEKERDERFQSARDVRFTLETLSDADRVESAPENEAPPQDPTTSIAVLPFKDLSPEKDQDYFCEGMAEEISTALTQVRGLRVAAASSAFQFGDKAHDARQVGEALGVNHLLEGSVRTSGKRLRVTAQLVNVADGYRVWSKRFDREMEDVFAIQDEISSNIVDALQEKFGEASVAIEPVKRHSKNLDAYHLYLKGRHAFERRYRGGPHKALPFFEQAVALDPSYALAHAGIGDCCTILGLYGFVPPQEARDKVEMAVRNALEIDENVAEAHTTLARFLWMFGGSMDECDREFRRALKLNPSDVQAWCWYAFCDAQFGRSDEAIAKTAKAIALDPLSPYPLVCRGVAHILLGTELRKTIEPLEKALEIDPDHSVALWTLAESYGRAGEHGRAIEFSTRVTKQSGRAPYYVALLGWALAIAGHEDEARRILAELGERAKSEYVAPVFLAQIHAGLGENHEAMEWLERAEEEGGPLRVMAMFPRFDNLRGDARFKEMCQRFGIPPSA